MNGVVIFAGGIGSRMGDVPLPKQFLDLDGKPIIARTLEVFEACDLVDVIAVVCVEDWIDRCREIIAAEGFDKVRAVVPGGGTGQESIFNGLVALRPLLGDDDIVIMHDGVRPLIYPGTVSDCIHSIEDFGVTATVAPAIETVLFDDGESLSALDRSRCSLARAPQGARFGDVYRAHLWAREQGRSDFIDTISLMRSCGHEIHTVDGPVENIKVTTPIDYLACVAYYRERIEREGMPHGLHRG